MNMDLEVVDQITYFTSPNFVYADSETDDQTKTSNRKKIKAGSYIIKQRDPKSIKDSSILSIDMSEIESPSSN